MRASHPAFYVSLFLARLADQILLFLVPLVVYRVTGKVSWSGAAFALEALPRFLAFPLCGALCDRHSPLALLRASQRLRALVCVAGIIGYQTLGGIGWLVALSALCGVLTSQGLVAREVMLPTLFPGHRFEKVLSHTQLADQLGVVLGPMLAAVLLQQMMWQTEVAADAALFMLADGALWLWRRGKAVMPAPAGAAPLHWGEPFRIALAQVLHLPGLSRLVLLAAGENLVIGVTTATSAAIVTGTHHQSAGYYAALQTAGALATVAVLIGISRYALTSRVLGLLSFLAICGGGILAGLSPHIAGYTLGFLLIVGFDKMFSVYIRSARQRIIPPADYGKTTGVVILLNNLTQPLAGALVGFFAQRAGAMSLVLVMSLVMAGLGAAVTAATAARRASRDGERALADAPD